MSIVRNTGYNLAASLVPIAISLVVLPIYIRAIGEARYGMFALISALVGYFGVLDLGLSSAIAQRMAAAGSKDIDAKRKIFWTAAAINLAMGLFGAALILPVALLYVDHGLTLEPALAAEFRASAVWLVLALPVTMITGVMSGALRGAGLFGDLGVINVGTGTLSQLLPLAAALWLSPSLTVVLPVLYLSRAVSIAWFGLVIARKILLSWRPQIDRGRARDLLSFGGWVSISALVSPLLTTLDRYLIGSISGVRAVTHYSVPYQLTSKSLILPVAIVSSMLPRVASAGPEEARELGKRGIRSIAALMGPGMIGGVVLLRPVMEWWIGPDFAQASAFCGQILIAGFWWNALGVGCNSWLHAVGRVRLTAMAHLMEVVPYVGMLFVLLKFYGIAGAAMAFVFRISLDALILGKFAGFGKEIVRLSVLGGGLFALAFALALPGGPISGPLLAKAAVPVLLSSALSLAWLYQERTLLRSVFRWPVRAEAGG